MNEKIISSFLIMFFLINFGFAQDIDIEKTYTISKDAKKGFLGDVKFDPATGNYTLSYLTVAKKKYVKFEHYLFDKDFNFVKMEPEELEFAAAKQKYSWWNFKGEDYFVDGISADPNLTGTFVLRKVRYNYNYRWLYGDYTLKTDVLEKVKLRTEEGDKYFYFMDYQDENTGELYVLCGIKDKKDKESIAKNIELLKIDNEMNVVKKYQKTFTFPGVPDLLDAVTDDDGNVTELTIIFGSTKDHKYVRLNSKLEVLEEVDFTVDETWTAKSLIIADDGYYFYGPSGERSYSVVKFKSGKVMYNSTTTAEELGQKLKKPPTQKKDPEYKGKRLFVDDHLITAEGDLLFTGQLIQTKYNVVKDELREVFTNLITFHYDKDGNLKAQYGVDPRENNEYVKLNGTQQFLVEGKNNVYWVIKETKDMGWQYPSIFKINKSNSTINDPVQLGNEQYYLEYNFPYLESKDKDKLTFFGSDKKGKTIWVCRIRLD